MRICMQIRVVTIIQKREFMYGSMVSEPQVCGGKMEAHIPAPIVWQTLASIYVTGSGCRPLPLGVARGKPPHAEVDGQACVPLLTQGLSSTTVDPSDEDSPVHALGNVSSSVLAEVAHHLPSQQQPCTAPGRNVRARKA